jgi:hypothetical protein
MVHFLGATTLPAERRASRARCCESNGGSIRSWPRPALPRVSLANRPLATHPDARLLDGPDVVPKTPLATSSCGPVRSLVRAATIVPERAPNMGGTVSEQRWERRPELRVHLQALDRTAEFIAALREQVQAERQAHAETRRLLALQGRVEELEAKLALVEKKTS